MTGGNKENNKNEKCPLCKVSEESLRVLKDKGREIKFPEKTKQKTGFLHKLFKK